MKKVLLISAILGVCAAFPEEVPFSIDDVQSDLREYHRQVTETYGKLKKQAGWETALPTNSPIVEKRLKEFSTRLSMLPLEQLPALPQCEAGASLMWRERKRNCPREVASAEAFNCGPGKRVVPATGEFKEEVADVSFAGRGGLVCELTRYYRSGSDYDCGFGRGWDHSFNAGLVFDNEAVEKSETCVGFWQGQEVVFSRKGGEWVSDDGHFLSLDEANGRMIVMFPSRTRLEFERAAEQVLGKSRWRVVSIASRHDGWKANRIELSYTPKCDRLCRVTGVRGETIDFAYDKSGHVIAVQTAYKRFDFAYDGQGCLVRVVCPKMLVSVSPIEEVSLTNTYEYAQIDGRWLMTGKRSSVVPFARVMKYDGMGRVVQCGHVSNTQSQLWNFGYEDHRTIVRGPEPSPMLEYSFAGTPHPTLPNELRIAAQGAVWRYAYNDDYLPVETIDPLGVRTVNAYDTKNADRRMQGNLIEERRLAGAGVAIDWKEFGSRTRYADGISLPLETVTYQVTTNGVEQVVKRERCTYRESDWTIATRCVTGGAEGEERKVRIDCNRYGEVALEVDANGNATISEYASALPMVSSYDFVDGTCDGAGYLVRKIEDATEEQIEMAVRQLGVARVYRNEIQRVPPVALERRYAWDVFGNQIRSECGHSLEVTIKNDGGNVLAAFDSALGVTVTRYRPDGRVDYVDHEFDPDRDALFRGSTGLAFDGEFYRSACEYDDLSQLSGQETSNEEIQGVRPQFKYERYPSGKMKRVTNPVGVTREDVYDPQTGFLVCQMLKGVKEDLTLGRNLSWYPNGVVRSFEDRSGSVVTNRLDGFGRICEVLDGRGVVHREVKDALGRIVAKSDVRGIEVLSQSQIEYDVQSGESKIERVWKSEDGERGKWLETVRNVYDSAGQVVASRGVRDGSWTVALFDGLGRSVASRNPVGDMTGIVYDGDVQVMTQSWAKRDQDDEVGRKQGSISRIDSVGREVEQVPVDAANTLAVARCMTNEYDVVGQKVRTVTQGLAEAISRYNSLGWVVSETTNPLKCENGEKSVITTKRYRADGSVAERVLENDALALVGRRDDVKPELVSAPQKTETRYDEFGRVAKTVNPDGLVLEYEYNAHSYPVRMRWTHLAESPTNILRDVRLVYNAFGQVVKVVDGKTDQLLQAFEYDVQGRLTCATDRNQSGIVKQGFAYDSLGQVVSERMNLDGEDFPLHRLSSDPVAGKKTAAWEELECFGSAYWLKEIWESDVAGRVRCAYLDEEEDPFVQWEYVGSLPTKREIPGVDLVQECEYTDLGEVSRQRVGSGLGGTRVGELNYAYGPQGQAEYAGTQFNMRGRPYQFAHYAQFDSLRRLVAQNGESVLPGKGRWEEDWKRVFGHGKEKSVTGLGTGRMHYDQANNIWARYTGSVRNADPEDIKFAAVRENQQVQFTSSAKVIPNGVIPDKRELASNREVTKASFGNDDRLSAEEYEYDRRGNLVCYKGQYWNGADRFAVKWRLSYDVLGRLSGMVATADEDRTWVRKGGTAAELAFAYDASNRRLLKRVVDYSRHEQATTNLTYTLYEGNQQKLVFVREGGRIELSEEYLWNGNSRELLMAAMARGERNVSVSPERYYFQQDRALNAVYVSKWADGMLVPVSASSYLGFGENATEAEITGIRSSLAIGSGLGLAYDHRKDEDLSARWFANGGRRDDFLELTLREEQQLSDVVIWSDVNFPKDFLVMVLPSGVDSPSVSGFDAWVRGNAKKYAEYVVAECKDGVVQGVQKRDSIFSPYRIHLGDRKGSRIVIMWDRYDYTRIDVREFEVHCVPNNPSAIAYAGQWLDRETGLYYQVNRYRLAGSDKFISPDPLGFAGGNNLYAYANGNPLEWHDPDGRFAVTLGLGAQVAIGAAAGALINSGAYLLQCWLFDREFSWMELGIHAVVGAASGAVAALTFGIVNPFLAGIGFNAVANFMVSGAVTGLASGFTAGATDSLLHGEGVADSLMSGAKEGAWGALGGAIGSGIVAKMGASLSSALAAGAVAGGTVSGLRSATETYMDTGDWEDTMISGLTGAALGAGQGASIASASWHIGRWTGKIQRLKGYPEHLPDPRQKGIMIRTKAYKSQGEIGRLLKPFKSLLSYRDEGYDGVTGQSGYAIHHVKPVSLGGTTTRDNLVPIPIELHAGSGNAHPGPIASRQPEGTIFY